MVTTTTVYSFQKPDVSGDEDAWGGYLNANVDKYESILTGNTIITSVVITTADINGGTLDNVVIGDTTAAVITGTTITGTGFVSSGNMTFGDNNKALFGASSDLEVYHNGTNSVIYDNGTGNLQLVSGGASVDIIKAGGENMATFATDGAVTLYYDNAAKIATSSSGISVSGTVTADGLTVNSGTDNEGISVVSTDAGSYISVADNGTTGSTRFGAVSNDFKIDVNSAERLRITSAGSVGIGTSSPNTALEVKQTSGTATIRVHADHESSSRAAIELMRGTSDTFGGDAFTDWKLGQVGGGSQADFAIISSDTTRGSIERLTLEYDTGNVGIGTSSPSRDLYISGGGSSRADVQLSYDALGTSSVDGVQLGIQASGGYIWNFENSSLYFATNNAERLRIDSSGDVLLKTLGAALQWNNGYQTITGQSTANDLTYRTYQSHIFKNTTSASSTTDGTEVMRINSSGLVGIGTSSPTANGLTISSSVSGASAMNFHIGGSATAPSAGSYATLSNNNHGDVLLATNAYINTSRNPVIINTHASMGATGIQIGGNSNGTIRFYTQQASSTAGTEITNAERMRIDSSGNVLIGTTTSGLNSQLTVEGTAITIRSGTTGNGNLFFSDGTSGNERYRGYIYYSHSTDHLGLGVSGFEAMRIDSSGLVGIGTSSISYPLDVRKNSTTDYVSSSTSAATPYVTGDSVISLTNATSTTNRGAFLSLGSTDAWGVTNIKYLGVVSETGTYGGNFVIGGRTASTAYSEHFRINSNGDVGIGTAAPTSFSTYRYLDVVGSATTTGGVIQSKTSDGSLNLLMYTGGSLAFIGTSTNHGLAFLTNNSTKMVLDASGHLLVGKTSDDFATEGTAIRGSTSGSKVTITRDGNNALALNRLTSDGSIITFNKDGSTKGSIGAAAVGGTLYIEGDSVGSGLQFGNANIYPRDAGALSDGAIDLGHGSYRFDDIYATNGTIQTSDRNEKQDIEELTDAEQKVAVAAKGLLRKFRWKDRVAEKGDKARTHFGIIAQDLQAAFAAEGLDASDYAMFISTTWTDEETGEERTRMGVRYSELLAFIIAAI